MAVWKVESCDKMDYHHWKWYMFLSRFLIIEWNIAISNINLRHSARHDFHRRTLYFVYVIQHWWVLWNNIGNESQLTLIFLHCVGLNAIKLLFSFIALGLTCDKKNLKWIFISYGIFDIRGVLIYPSPKAGTCICKQTITLMNIVWNENSFQILHVSCIALISLPNFVFYELPFMQLHSELYNLKNWMF